MEDECYSINQDIDTEINKAFPTINFANTFFGFLPLSLIDNGVTKNENSRNLLLEAVRQEYGIDREVNFDYALNYYTLGSNQNNRYCLYKLYLISKDPTLGASFKVIRNKNLEMFNLLKAHAYSYNSKQNVRIYQVDYHLFLESEVSMQLKLDDPSLNKTNRLFLEIAPTVDETELSYVEAITLLTFNVNEDDRALGRSVLHYLADSKCYLPAVLRLACLYSDENDIITAGKYFQTLIDKKFYEAYQDYIDFEINKGIEINSNKHYYRELLSEAISNGNNKSFYFYYRLSLHDLIVDDVKKFLNENLSLIIKDIINGNYFILLDYFIIMKKIKKSKEIDQNDDQINYFKIISSKLSENYKNISTNDSSHSKIFNYLTMAYVSYSINKEYEAAENLFKKSYDLLKASKEIYSKSYIKFCYYFIFRSRSKQFYHSLQIKLQKTKLKLFKIFIETHITCESFTNSSFDYYCLGKIYENGWGTEINELKSFACYYRSSSSTTLDFSFISVDKRSKSQQKIITSEKFSLLSKEMLKLKDFENFEENSLCNICFEDNMEILFLPCKHMVCKECYRRKFEIEKKCPHCRNEIISIL